MHCAWYQNDTNNVDFTLSRLGLASNLVCLASSSLPLPCLVSVNDIAALPRLCLDLSASTKLPWAHPWIYALSKCVHRSCVISEICWPHVGGKCVFILVHRVAVCCSDPVSEGWRLPGIQHFLDPVIPASQPARLELHSDNTFNVRLNCFTSADSPSVESGYESSCKSSIYQRSTPLIGRYNTQSVWGAGGVMRPHR